MKVTFPKEPEKTEIVKQALKAGNYRYINPFTVYEYFTIGDLMALFSDTSKERRVANMTTEQVKSLFYNEFNEQLRTKDTSTRFHVFLRNKFGPDTVYWFYKKGGQR